MIWQVKPPSELVTNFEAIREWLIFVGIIVAVLVGVFTLIGMAVVVTRRWWKKRKENNGETRIE